MLLSKIESKRIKSYLEECKWLLKLDLHPFSFLSSTAFLPFRYNDFSFEVQSSFPRSTIFFLPGTMHSSFEVQWLEKSTLTEFFLPSTMLGFL